MTSEFLELTSSKNVEIIIYKQKSDFLYNQLFAIVFLLDIVETVMCGYKEN